MATKNQIAQTIWIMKAMQIIGAKSHKQSCLEYIRRERVGIVFSETSKNQNPQTVENQGFAGSPFWERVLTLRNRCGTIWGMKCGTIQA